MATAGDNGSLAWQLRPNLNHFENLPGVEFDLIAEEPFTESKYYGLFWETEIFDLPSPIVFRAMSDAVPFTDYPYIDLAWPIMSRRMLDVLRSVGEFSYRIYPIQVRQGLTIMDNVDFVVVQLLSHEDYFNWEKSVYECDNEGKLDYIYEYSIDAPDQGLPPLFRLSVSPTRLFVSGKARQALKEASICGTRYIPLNSFTSEIDVPVIIPTRS